MADAAISLRRALIVICSVMACACQLEEPEAIADCSVDAQKQLVHEVMSNVYLWADQAPTIDPTDYATPNEVVDAMRYHQRDFWTSIIPLKPYVDYFEKGETLDFGYLQTWDAAGNLRVTWVVQGSPAGRAGLERGATILEIGGKTIAEISAGNLWGEVLGPNERGVSVVHRIKTVAGEELDLPIDKDVIQVDKVPVVEIFPSDQGDIGYVLFMSFVGPSEADLRTAFDGLREQGVRSVIVDLRYNGGGYVWIAGLIGSLIGGADLEGEVLLRNTYNPNWSEWNAELKLTNEPESIGAERVVFLTSGSTASASELLVNGLKPFMDVKLVGNRTYGKPVGADAWQYCDNVLSAITFRSLNADGEGDYFDGIPVDCEVPDDLDHALGDPEEWRLEAALSLLRGGACLQRPLPEVITPEFDIDLARQQLENLRPMGMGSVQ